jgi:hypothetical protein
MKDQTSQSGRCSNARGRLRRTPIEVADRPDPVVARPTDAIARVVLGCVCGSDLWYYRGESQHALGPIGPRVRRRGGAGRGRRSRHRRGRPCRRPVQVQRRDVRALQGGMDVELRRGRARSGPTDSTGTRGRPGSAAPRTATKAGSGPAASRKTSPSSTPTTTSTTRSTPRPHEVPPLRAASIVSTILSPEARSSTIKLVPRK